MDEDSLTPEDYLAKLDVWLILYNIEKNADDQTGWVWLVKEPALRARPKSDGEYLVDLAWEQKGDDEYYLELVLESELSDSEIDDFLYDFYKIVDLKAHIKVGIFYISQDQFDARAP